VLHNGERLLLLDGRGWSSSAAIAHQSLEEIERTARMVVGPDGPGPDETDQQMAAWYWERMEHKLRDAGIAADAAELQGLVHDVEISERLRRRLGISPDQ
jgi:hypothetical protein